MSSELRSVPERELVLFIQRCAGLVALAVLIALVCNTLHPMGLPLLLVEVPHPGIPVWIWRSVPSVSVTQGYELWRHQSALLLDVRDRADHLAGHIPGSLSLPYHEFSTTFPAVRDRLPLHGPILIYCYGSHCGLSMRVAKRLRVLGYDRLTVMEGGFDAWQAAGLPISPATEGAR